MAQDQVTWKIIPSTAINTITLTILKRKQPCSTYIKVGGELARVSPTYGGHLDESSSNSCDAVEVDMLNQTFLEYFK